MTQSKIHKIVVVGGGAGGLELVTRLGKSLGKKQRAQITLVDCTLTHVWKPLWHEVAAGTFSPSDGNELNYISHAYQNHFNFEWGKLNGLDPLQSQIHLAPILDEHHREILPSRFLSYDTLIIAIGSMSNDFGTKGARDYCHFLDSLKEAERFHRDLLRKILHSQNELLQEGRSELTIAIIGAGATGVELAAELYYVIRQVARYRHAKVSANYRINIMIIEAASRILPSLSERISRVVTKQLNKMGIEIHTGQKVTEINQEGLRTESGLFVLADLKVWAAGIQAPEILKELPLETNRIHQILVEPTLKSVSYNNIFAFGDCASCPQPQWDNRTVPPRAQAAHQQANLLFHSMKKILQGKPLSNYRYKDYGSLITLSSKGTIGSLMGALRTHLFIEGKIARLIYISLYKRHQIALYGFWHVAVMTIASWMTQKVRPRLKLH